MTQKSRPLVRPAVGAGRWFPGDRAALRKMVAGYIEQAAPVPITGRIVSAIAPHAGYQYSGPVAGYTYRALRDQARAGQAPVTVVIIGFSHRGGFPGVALMDGEAIATPLGETPLDGEALAVLTNSAASIRADYTPHQGEHSAENQVPFIQVALPEAQLAIGLIGDHEPRTREALAQALATLAGKKRIVIVASSDMLHDPDYALVTATDRKTLQAVAALEADGVLRAWSGQRQIFCGINAVWVAMRYAVLQGCTSGTVLTYRNSGDDFPESRGEWVVGYGAVAFAVAKQVVSAIETPQ